MKKMMKGEKKGGKKFVTIASMMAMMDKNGDGSISDGEF